ncbi:MAG: hypothetical protein E7337_04435 [Clostridiales bacterium]|nr:hypothetical protein [Clostridiales bacterium]
MFGYIITNHQTLPEDRQQRFRAFYCGLCRALNRRHGKLGQATLSYDMTFMALFLNALYEPEEISGEEKCFLHPIKKHPFVDSKIFDYVADMNVALAYHKCRDNWMDDKNVPSAAEAKLLERAYRRVEKQYPQKCAVIEDWLCEIHRIESENIELIDPPVNATGRMLGELFVYDEDDIWADSLRIVGDGLGRFIYLMDAYDDLPADIRRKRYNPLKAYLNDEGFENMCRDALMMMVADCTQEFERLPIIQDADIIRNVLYSGIWSKYAMIQKKKEARSKGAK